MRSSRQKCIGIEEASGWMKIGVKAGDGQAHDSSGVRSPVVRVASMDVMSGEFFLRNIFDSILVFIILFLLLRFHG